MDTSGIVRTGIDMHEDTRLSLGPSTGYSQQRKYVVSKDSKVKLPQMVQRVLSDEGYNNSDETKTELSCAKLQSDEVSEDYTASELMELFPTRTGLDSVPGEIKGRKSFTDAFGEEEESRRIKGYSFLGHSCVEGTVPQNDSTRSWASPTPADLGEQSMSPPEMTIFYNGTVNVYKVSAFKAQAIMFLAFASSGNAWQQSPPATSSNASPGMAAGFDNLPLARKKSFQRFLENRKYRISATTPYTNSSKLAAE